VSTAVKNLLCHSGCARLAKTDMLGQRRYAKAELEAMAEVLMWIEDIRTTFQKEKTWLVPLLTKGMAQNLVRFMGDVIPEIYQGASEKVTALDTVPITALR
jgi:hypothetical protein